MCQRIDIRRESSFCIKNLGTEETMTEVIGVRFKQVGKIYYFSPNGVQMPVGEKVIVETARGIECGEVALSNREIED